MFRHENRQDSCHGSAVEESGWRRRRWFPWRQVARLGARRPVGRLSRQSREAVLRQEAVMGARRPVWMGRQETRLEAVWGVRKQARPEAPGGQNAVFFVVLLQNAGFT